LSANGFEPVWFQDLIRLAPTQLLRKPLGEPNALRQIGKPDLFLFQPTTRSES